VDIKFSAHDVKIVFVENHGLLSGIYIVPYSDNQPFKLGWIPYANCVGVYHGTTYRSLMLYYSLS
jgi:hypothetical protein